MTNQNGENPENETIDEGVLQDSGEDGHGDNEIPACEEKEEKVEEEELQKEELDTEQNFQQSLDHLGIISVHHDGKIRFWTHEVPR